MMCDTPVHRHRFPRMAVSDLGARGPCVVAARSCTTRHDHPGRAEAALQTVAFPEAVLHRVKVPVRGEALDRRDLGAIGLDGEQRAGLDGAAVHEDGARAADAGLAPDVGPGQIADLAQEMNQQQPRLDVATMFAAVDAKSDGNHGPPPEGRETCG